MTASAVTRRVVLTGAASTVTASLAAPHIAAAAEQKILKFIPQSDPLVLDPIWTPAYVTRNHGFMIFDTLFGTDESFVTSPQMAAGVVEEDDGKTVRITLRDGLKWHDGERVLARDCVASIQRWSVRDVPGQTLAALTDELSAPDDRTIQLRLKRPFAYLTAALGKSPTNFPAMMPERLAKTDAFKQVTEMVGSGPYKFRPDERVVGSFAAYERFADYVPRSDGIAQWTAGPKIAHFDRVEWHAITDPSIALVALQKGEVDWWETPSPDLLPRLRRSAGIDVRVLDTFGAIGCLRMNQLYPPFDNADARRALLKAVSQTDFAIAVAGEDKSLWHVPSGFFCPGTPMASAVGLDVFQGPRDYDGVKRALQNAGYAGQTIAMIAPIDTPNVKALADVCLDLLQKCGMTVDYQTTDFGTAMQRRARKDPIGQGGWNVMCSFFGGLDQLNPIGHTFLRAPGPATGTNGWPNSPKLEALREQWIEATAPAAQVSIAEAIQRQALIDVPYIPLGQSFTPSAISKTLVAVPKGFPMFWNVRRA